jgi:SAM-dependent methyltransferase
MNGYKDYGFQLAAPSHMHRYFMPKIFNFCGATCGYFLNKGCQVVGIDLSESGIAIARQAHPNGKFEILGAGEDTLERLKEAPFDLVISTEVVEHLYAPRPYAQACFDALKPGGKFICTTPYHGYLKNLALSLTNHWDKHANPLWDGGHIKLWSRNTLTCLLSEAGLTEIEFQGAGRWPWMWMTMVMSGKKPII